MADDRDPQSVIEQVAHAILALVARVPESDLSPSGAPRMVARSLGTTAAVKAAVVAGSLALPPGPLGWLTILPEMAGVLRIQSHLAADIARVYGRTATLTPEQMLYCLFRHSAAQAVRDLAVRAGERLLVQEVSTQMIQSVARAIGLHLTERAIGRGVSRWVPIVGAIGVGGYAYYDTTRVAATAVELFEADTTST
jgi:hypothetical protein